MAAAWGIMGGQQMRRGEDQGGGSTNTQKANENDRERKSCGRNLIAMTKKQLSTGLVRRDL